MKSSLPFMILVNFWFSFYAAANYNTDAYYHLSFQPIRIRDVMPRLRQSSHKRLHWINKTKYRLEIDLYFNPHDASAAAFLETRLNVRRENNRWHDFQTQPTTVKFMPANDYNELIVGAARISRQIFDYDMDFNEPCFPSDCIVATSVLTHADILNPEPELSLDPSAPLMGEVAVAIPLEFSRGSVPVQVRLSINQFDFPDPANSIIHRKIYYGEAQLQPLTKEEKIKIAQLIRLTCEKKLTGPHH